MQVSAPDVGSALEAKRKESIRPAKAPEGGRQTSTVCLFVRDTRGLDDASRHSGYGMNMKKTGDHFAVTTRKVIYHGSVKIMEAVSEYKVQDNIFYSEFCNMLCPSTYMGFTSKAQELQRGSLGAVKSPALSFASTGMDVMHSNLLMI